MEKECHAANTGKPKALECKAVEITGATAQNTYKQAKQRKQSQIIKEITKKFSFYLVNNRVQSWVSAYNCTSAC